MAFTVLVERHGPMVWRVCRRVLTDPHEAEDAFQATFLVLARQARSIRNRDSVASWLYGVALRVARAARSAAARRRRHEGSYRAQREVSIEGREPEQADLIRLVDEELGRLPEDVRAALVLCDLEDLTHEQAAAQLGWPAGTVKSRLSRGRERLRSRLARRGLAPSTGLLAVTLTGESTAAAIPPALVRATVQTAARFGVSRFAVRAVPAAVASLLKKESTAMWVSKLRWAAAALLGVGAVLGLGLFWNPTEARQHAASQAGQAKPADRAKQAEDAVWARHVGNLKRVGLALVNYQAAEGHYPPAAITSKEGKPLLSWRVAILPYLEDFDGRSRDDLFKAFRLDEPWDSPHNKVLLAEMPAVFASPGDRSAKPSTTVYRGFIGSVESEQESRTTFEPGEMISVAPGTLFRARRGVEVREITDGTSNTIMVAEAAESVPWTKPDDLAYADDRPLPRLGGTMSDGFAALFASGHVRFLDRKLDGKTLRGLITRNGGEILPAFPPPGSFPLAHGANPAGSSPGFPQRFAGAGTLRNAMGILTDKLNHEGKSELAGLLSEQQARQSIRAVLRGYELHLRRVGEPQTQRDQFQLAKPLLEQIAFDGTWPADCWFSTSSGIEARDGISYDRFRVMLNVEAMDREKPSTFSVLILDVFAGPVEPVPAPEDR
jgi:RNA polymerase sigma factor (sigma-70 family)